MCGAISQSPIILLVMKLKLSIVRGTIMYSFVLALEWCEAMVIITIRRWLAFVTFLKGLEERMIV